jgi:GTP diphosphokinase / guanosine-3',5'-bis(diphosphate) 3'-diphosphatase
MNSGESNPRAPNLVAPGVSGEHPGASNIAAIAHRLMHAIRFAAEHHRDDRRKGATAAPYINHPIIVAEQLAAHGLGEDVELLMAAVLHDVIEDTDATFEELNSAFGQRVAEVVQEVSDDKTLEKEARRKVVVDTIAHKSLAARLVKLSDLIANVHDIVHHPPQWSQERKLNYLRWAGRIAEQVTGTHAGLEAALAAELAAAHKAVGA